MYDREQLDDMSINAQRELREGNADHAADLFRQLVAAWTTIEGPDGEAVLNWRGWIAQSLIAARRYTAAEEVLYQLLDDRARVLGADHLSVLVARGHLSKTISLAGRHDEAMLIAERLLSDRVRLLGQDDEATLATRGIIAEIHLQAGRPADAAAAYESLLADRIRVLGDTHHQTRITEDNLRLARSRLANPASAIAEMLERAYVHAGEYGNDDLDTITMYAQVAEAMSRVGRHAEALVIIDGVIGRRTEVLGPDDHRTLTAQRLRALTLLGLKRFEDAHDAIWATVDAVERLGRADETEACHFYVDALYIDVEHLRRGRRSKRPDARALATKARRQLTRLLPRLEPDSPLRRSAQDLFARLDALG